LLASEIFSLEQLSRKGETGFGTENCGKNKESEQFGKLGETKTVLDEDLALISQAAKQAGKIALQFFGRDPQIWMKEDDKSPVSEADFAVDRYLKQALLQARPDYGWISEESTDERSAQHYQRSFVVDPIDGTRGFLNGSSQWCVSVAIIESGQPICGVLECPACNEHYCAHSEMVAMFNGEPLDAQAPERLTGEKIRLSCVSSLARKLPPDFGEKIDFAPSIPSLAYRLAFLARGELDVVLVRPGCHDWDIAAADIILRQSGHHQGGHQLLTVQGAQLLYGVAPFRHDILLAGDAVNYNDMIPYLV